MNRKIVSHATTLLLGTIMFFTLINRMRSQEASATPVNDSAVLRDTPQTSEGPLSALAAVASNPRDEDANAPASSVASGSESTVRPESHRWSLHAQSTVVIQGTPGMHASYSGSNSMTVRGETRETLSGDLYGGLRLWSGAEAHVDLLTWQGFGLNDTLGIEDFPNGEAYKAGTRSPRSNLARLFIRQTLGLGPGTNYSTSDDQLTFANDHMKVSHLTLTFGRFSVKDIFDNNTYANDARSQFMNWALMANAAWDYPSDALGYTTGAAIELNREKWTLRYGFFQIDRLRNAWTAEDAFFTWPTYKGAGDGPFWRAWGMAEEYERRYQVETHPGAIRMLAYLNHGRMGSYSAALSEPKMDISNTRSYRQRYGLGLNVEQELIKGIGVFSRVGWNDGQSEAWMFTDVNFSGSLGISVNGGRWCRPNDTFGLGAVISGASRSNQEFLKAGGTGILDGDGALDYAGEKGLEMYYDYRISRHLHAAADYQFIENPAFNEARGPASVFGTRLHWQF